MIYKIVHGELGFDIMKNGKVHKIGYSTRGLARTDIRIEQNHARAKDQAREAFRKLRVALREDYGLSNDEVSEIFEEETRP